MFTLIVLLACFGISITEITGYFPEFCLRAVQDERLFNQFRSEYDCQRMVENVTYEQGLQLLDVLQENSPHLLSKLDQVQREDRFGLPETFEYSGIGALCPATLRYIKIAGDLESQFENLKDFKILEIGGGYGGQCKIIHNLFGFKSYTIIDLPQCIPLISKYLNHFHVPNIQFFQNDDLNRSEKYDLFISNYAFSEINRIDQLEYLEKVVANIPRGYITCNNISSFYNIESLTLEELVFSLSKQGRIVNVQPENPLTGADNVVITWYPVDRLLKKVEGKRASSTNIDKIDFIYLINLDQRPEKLQKSVEQLEKYQLTAHRFPAIYGWTLPPETFHQLGLNFRKGMTPINLGWPEHSDVSFLPGSGKKERLSSSSYGKSCFHSVLSPGGIGCTLSHLSILKDAYDSGYETIWVLEDDFKIEGDPHCLSAYIQELNQLVGHEGWDVLYTDETCRFTCFEHSHDCWRPDMPQFDQYSLLKTEGINDHFLKIGARARTHSMILSRSGIKKILDFELNRGIFNPYDAEIAFIPGIHLYCLKQNLITWNYDGSDTVYQNF